jgi:hypothetical protein
VPISVVSVAVHPARPYVADVPSVFGIPAACVPINVRVSAIAGLLAVTVTGRLTVASVPVLAVVPVVVAGV